MSKRPLRVYLSNYYRINRRTWPDMKRRSALLDAMRLTWKIRGIRDHS